MAISYQELTFLLVYVLLPLLLLLTRNCPERILWLTYVAAEWTWTYSKHILHDRYPASLLACHLDLQKTQLTLLLCGGLWTCWSNPLQLKQYLIHIPINCNKLYRTESFSLRKINSYSGTQQIFCLLHNTEIDYYIFKSLPWSYMKFSKQL
jgi:hypothetical protein